MAEQHLSTHIAMLAEILKVTPGLPPIDRFAYLVAPEEWDQLIEEHDRLARISYPDSIGMPVKSIKIAGMEVRRAG